MDQMSLSSWLPTDGLEMVVRLLAALTAGAMIGYERSYHGRPAGFRTHALVCTASCLLMFVTVYEAHWVRGASDSVRLDPTRMAPRVKPRPDDALSVEAEFGLAAARRAIEHAGCKPEDIDLVICSASHHQRPYPAIAIEIQNALGCGGFGFDMNVACSSATFGMQAAADMIRAGNATRALVINPEICSGHLNFRDRDSHFIFGDVATAIVLENLGGGTFNVVDQNYPRGSVVRTHSYAPYTEAAKYQAISYQRLPRTLNAFRGVLAEGYPFVFGFSVYESLYGADGKPFLWIASGGKAAPRVHVAIRAESRAQVDAFYKAALAAGGKDNGKPGLRPHYHATYYGAFVLDPDGNNIEAVTHKPE